MAKQITQDTFDDVVRENIQEFEMSPQEALDDAIKQFESQGVNLAMIIKDPSLYGAEGDTSVHPVIKAIESLSLTLDQASPAVSEIEQNLQTLQSECDIDLSRRCFAGKNNAYKVLIKSVKANKSNKTLLEKGLLALCSLCNGQPDLLEEEGVTTLMELMKENHDDVRVMELVVKLIRLNCVKHEMNRRAFVKADLIKELVTILEEHKNSATIVKEVSFCLRVLTFDDDVRVPFGTAHENAKKIVLEGNALQTLLEISKAYTDDIGVQGELFSTLGKLVVRNEFCKQVMDLGGLQLILSSFQTNLAHKGIVRQALDVLTALAGNDEIKIAIVKEGGIELVLSGMTQHQAVPQIACSGCQLLATLSLRQPGHCGKVIECNGHHVILQAMKLHPTEVKVQKHGCRAARNIVARTREYCDLFLQLGAEGIINAAMTLKGCEDEAKGALRDLNCQVELKERWTGQKGTLQ